MMSVPVGENLISLPVNANLEEQPSRLIDNSNVLVEMILENLVKEMKVCNPRNMTAADQCKVVQVIVNTMEKWKKEMKESHDQIFGQIEYGQNCEKKINECGNLVKIYQTMSEARVRRPPDRYKNHTV